MVDESPEDTAPEPGRGRRAPPTIDLEATEVTEETTNTAAGTKPEPEPPSQERRRAAIAPAIVSAISGACAAALVLAAAWYAGWPGEAAAPASPAVKPAAIDDLAARVAGLEARADKPAVAAPDPAAAARIEALEKSLAALRGELAGLRAQSEKLAASINEVKSAPAEAAPAPDLADINARIAAVERAARAQAAEIAQSAKPADDVALRRIVVAALLDVHVRTGDPYSAALAAAKSLAASPDALKPLDGFAASGVPGAAALSRELLALVPKLSPPSPENATTTGTSLMDRLQAGAAKLVRIERTDTVGNDRGNVIARVTAAALRNDFSEARRELKTLAPADRAAAQAWIEKADARDAALAASRQFAADAMSALPRPAP